MRTDEEVIDYILKQHQSHDDAARTLRITNRQTLYNWRTRGIPPGWRHALWMWCRRHGLKLGDDWLIKTLVAHEAFNPMSNGGGNGGARKGKSRKQAQRKAPAKGKRQQRRVKASGGARAQQRRAGRGVPALAAQD